MYHPIEQPEQIETRIREDAMGAYLMMFGALAAGLPLPIINLIAAVVYYYINKDKSRFVKFHSLQSLYSQIPTTLLNAGLMYWTFSFFRENGFSDGSNPFEAFASINELYWGYLYTVIAANLLYIVFSFIGAYNARKGRFFYFIFFGKLAYHQVYKIRNESAEIIENKPPSL